MASFSNRSLTRTQTKVERHNLHASRPKQGKKNKLLLRKLHLSKNILKNKTAQRPLRQN